MYNIIYIQLITYYIVVVCLGMLEASQSCWPQPQPQPQVADGMGMAHMHGGYIIMRLPSSSIVLLLYYH